MENGRTRDESQQQQQQQRRQQQQQQRRQQWPAAAAAVLPPQRSGDLLGRHRLSAAIGRLDKEIESLQKELEELDTLEPSSAACKQVVASTERLPDALLPVTRGPEDATWDRWFQRIRSSRGHKWYSFKRTI